MRRLFILSTTYNAQRGCTELWPAELMESQWSHLKLQAMAMPEPVVYIPLCLQLRIPEIGRSPLIQYLWIARHGWNVNSSAKIKVTSQSNNLGWNTLRGWKVQQPFIDVYRPLDLACASLDILYWYEMKKTDSHASPPTLGDPQRIPNALY